jgi:hypothetical protein
MRNTDNSSELDFNWKFELKPASDFLQKNLARSLCRRMYEDRASIVLLGNSIRVDSGVKGSRITTSAKRECSRDELFV